MSPPTFKSVRRSQHTLATTCQVRGRGYWSGKPVCVSMHPAAADHGIVLVRTDLPGRPECPADIRHTSEASLRTIVHRGDARFEMVEHLISALAGVGIDNCRVEIDAEELPGLDGSALAYVEALSSAGLILQARPKRRVVIRQSYRVGNDRAFVMVAPPKSDESYYEFQLSFDDTPSIPPQAYGVELNEERYIREVCSARTFVTLEQAESIRASGVANHVRNEDLLVIGDDGPIDNRYRYINECARHKTLDMIGDLALAGVEIVGRVTSFRGGHVLNGRMARRIAELARSETVFESNRSVDDDIDASAVSVLNPAASVSYSRPTSIQQRRAA